MFAVLCAFFATASLLLTFLHFVKGVVEAALDGVSSLATSALLFGSFFSHACLSSTATLAFLVNFGARLLVAVDMVGRMAV